MLPVEDLASLLRVFYSEMRKQDGASYSTSAFSGIRAAIQRHLNLAPFHRNINLKTNEAFICANNMWEAETTILLEEGKDSSGHHPPITTEDLQKLSKNIKIDNPVGLQQRVFVDFVIKLGRRGREGLRDFLVSDLVFETEMGREYCRAKQNQKTKGHQSGGARHDAATGRMKKNTKSQSNDAEKNKRMWAAPPSAKTCPVRTLKLYLSKLNPDCPNLFQVPNEKVWLANRGAAWYSPKGMGKDRLGGMMAKMSEMYDLSQRYTNHCLR